MPDDPRGVHGGASLCHATAGDVQFTEHVVSTAADGTQSVFATDLDGDVDLDDFALIQAAFSGPK